ncbi:hypothetical protein [Jatrophihabitans fulvus]
MTAPVISGGAGGITANRATIDHLATLHDAAAGSLLIEGLRLRPAFDGDPSGGLLGPALLDPAGPATLRRAADAVATLAAVARDIGETAVKLRAAAEGYPWDGSVLDFGPGHVLRGLLGSLDALGPLGRPAAGMFGGGRDPDGRIAGLDPETVDLVASLSGTAQLSAFAAQGSDGTGVALPGSVAQAPAPRTLADVVAGLADVDRDGTPGGIDVRIVIGPDGRRAAIVDITGTRTWTSGGRDVADLATNARGLVGRPTAYAQGVLAAMRQAGVRRGDAVMVVGHSQGGLVAVDVARQATRSGDFHVTHVVTAGSPIGLTVGALPPTVRVLALENDRDLVPRLDHRANPDRPNVTTVSGRQGDGSVGGDHDLDDSYVPLAGRAQAAGSRSVRDFVDSAGAFLGGLHVTQHAFTVERHR